MTIFSIDWTPMLTGAVLVYILGFVWFSPRVFGTRWATGLGLDINARRPAPAPLLVQAVYTFLLAWLVAVLFTVQIKHHLFLGVGPIFVGVTAVGMLTEAVWQRRNKISALITIGYFLASIAVLLAVQFTVHTMQM